MVDKTDLILEKIDCLQRSSTKIQVDIAKMNGHLKNLNGKIERHEISLNYNTKDIGRLKGIVKYFTGVGSTLIIIFTFFGDKIRGMFG